MGPLSKLRAVVPRSSNLLDLVFASVESHTPQCAATPITTRTTSGLSAAVQAAGPGGSVVSGEGPCTRFSLVFDCPSHLFKWHRVLQEWWATSPLPEIRQVVMLCGNEDEGWEFLPRPLATQHLDRRFGGLWHEVRPSVLEAATSNPSRDSRRNSSGNPTPPFTDWSVAAAG